jgi:hypothetical protein
LPRFARQEQNPTLGRGGKEKGLGENEFPPRPRFRRRNFSYFALRNAPLEKKL